MRLVMTLLVRDEADILESHLDYHLAQGVDWIIAMDNGSRDDTVDVLKAYEARGVLRLLPTRAGEYSQGPWVTEMARLAAIDHQADWVINNDADEYWWPSHGSLADVLAAVPEAYTQVRVPRNDFRPVRGDVARGEIFWRRLLVRDACSVSPRGLRLAPKVAHRADPEISITYGNHSAEGDDPTVAPPIGSLEILHYPIRDYEQFERKIRNIAEFSRDDPSRPPGALEDQLYLDDLRRAGELRRYYDSLTVEGASHEGSVDEATLMVDTRLRDFFETGTERRQADPAARSVVRETYTEVEAWMRDRLFPLREELATARLAEADLRRELTRLKAACDAVDAALVAERAEHYKTAEDLRLLRQSRAVRVARQMRRLRDRRR
jgi:hypothetical protein